MENNREICDICNNEILNGSYVTRDGDTICQDCYNDNFITCEYCDEIVHHNDAVCINDEWICNDCADEHYNRCAYCDNLITNDDEEVITNDDDVICERCYENYYGRCEHCENVFHENGLTYYEDDELCEGACEGYYCIECENELQQSTVNTNVDNDGFVQSVIASYHSCNRPEWHFLRTPKDTENDYTFGFELEIENNEDVDFKVFEYLKEKNVFGIWVENDGSLCNYSMEMITQPMTVRYFKEHLKDLKELLEFLASIGYKSHDTNGRCGLHFHFSKPSEKVQDRLLVIFETFKDEITTYSRREKGRMGYCNFSSEDSSNAIWYKSIKKIEENALKRNYCHGNAINFSPCNTVEFRIMRGTLKFESFVASWELLNNIYIECKKRKPLERITWDVLTRTKYAKRYVNERGIYSNIIPKDFSEDIETQERILRNNIIKFKCIMDEYINELVDQVSKCEYNNNYVNDVNRLVQNISNLRAYQNYSFSTLDYFNDTMRDIKLFLERASLNSTKILSLMGGEV